MPQVTGVPDFPFYMPGSAPVEYPMEAVARDRALQLAQRGYNAGVYVYPGDEHVGKTLEVADLYYETPRAPGYHFEQRYVEGNPRPPMMLPGGLSDRIAIELDQQQRGMDKEWLLRGGRDEMGRLIELSEPSQAEIILNEALQKARNGMPLRRPR